MKRREFLRTSAGLAVIAIPGVLHAESRPCPPGTVKATGGTSVTTTCGMDELADWEARSSGPGVVWAHNFEYDEEVTNFLQWPSGVSYGPDYKRGADGIAGGGCMNVVVPAADVAHARDPALPFGRGGWMRPYSPLRPDTQGDRSTGNGTGQTDRGDNLVPGGAKVWRRFNNPSWNAYTQYRGGVYGHSDYKTDPQQGEPYGWIWEGDQTSGFYIQCRIKVPAHRFVPTRVIPAKGQVYPAGDPLAGQIQTFFTNSTPVVGVNAPSKIAWWGSVTSSGLQPTTPAHEVVQNGYGKVAYNRATHQMRVYSGQNGAWSIVNGYSIPAGTSPPITVGNAAYEWEWPADKWVTVLCHVKPGHFNRSTAAGSLSGGDATVQFWTAVDGGDYLYMGGSATAKFWAYGPAYALNEPLGWNAFVATNYANGPDEYAASPTAYRNPLGGTAVTQTWEQKFTQIIFSREFIPAPRT